jgi:transcriptional regulator with XRE-family HTH domain
VILGGKAHVGELIRSGRDQYVHADLISEQLRPLSPTKRKKLVGTMLAGWIEGDGPQRQLFFALPDPRPAEAATALSALTDWAREQNTVLLPAELEDAETQTQQEIDVGTTIRRLLGLHALSAAEASAWIGVSAQALSEIQRGNRAPSLNTLRRISDLFAIPVDRLLGASFEELLRNELADPERFRSVERRIDEERTGGRR